MLAPLLCLAVFVTLALGFVRAVRRIEEIEREISGLEIELSRVDPVAGRRMDFDAKIAIVQLMLAAVFTVLFYFAAFYSP